MPDANQFTKLSSSPQQKPIDLAPGVQYYYVPRDFITLNANDAQNNAAKQLYIDFSQFYCVHGNLLYSPNFDDNSQILTEQEFQEFSSSFDVIGDPIKFTCSDVKVVITEKETCDECRDARESAGCAGSVVDAAGVAAEPKKVRSVKQKRKSAVAAAGNIAHSGKKAAGARKSSGKKKKANADDQVYDVQCIVGHRFVDSDITKPLFKVRWKGYGPESDTWQTIDTFNDTDVLIEYMQETKAADVSPETDFEEYDESLFASVVEPFGGNDNSGATALDTEAHDKDESSSAMDIDKLLSARSDEKAEEPQNDVEMEGDNLEKKAEAVAVE